MNTMTKKRNNAVTILVVFLLCLISTNAYAELRNNQSADVVVGQANFTSRTANQTGSANVKVNTLNQPLGLFSDGTRLFIAELFNHRVLIYNSIPTSNNASADVVVGQANFTSRTANQTGSANVQANTLNEPWGLFFDGKRLFVADKANHRVLIYNSIPTSNNASADVVVGQANFTSRTANQTGSANVKANTLNQPVAVFSDGKRLFIADDQNHRVLIYNSIPTSNNASADVVVGQANFTSRTANQTGSANVKANTLNRPLGLFSDGTRLFIADFNNHRVLIYNSIPTSNNASADVVVGQANFTSQTANQTGSANVKVNTLNNPLGLFSDGKRLFVADKGNNRVLIYNSIPTSNNASADVVVGQANFTSRTKNQTGVANVNANTLNDCWGLFFDGKRLFIADNENNRVLIYTIAGSSIELGPQFEQGKAVLGKVFNDLNSNGIQDEEELGIEGVRIASDTGIYAITDEDGKYHFPYIETGQHLLKVDPVTLPEGSAFITDNPYKITVTKGVLTKVSFGVKLPEELNELKQPSKLNEPSKPLLRVSITQDSVLLKPKLAVSITQDKDRIIFKIDCNYRLFIEKAKLVIYNQNYESIMSIDFSKPLPFTYTLLIKDLPIKQDTYYYQLSVNDKQNREDRTGVGSFEVE